MGIDNSVSGQLVGSPSTSRSPFTSATITCGVLVVAVAVAVWAGVRLESNPIDRVARCLAELPITLLLVDLWVLAVVLARRRLWGLRAGLAILPLVVAGVHVLLWVLARHLVSFEVFYGLEPTEGLWRPYTVRGWTVGLLGLVVLLCAGAAALQVHLIRRVSGQMRPGVSSTVQGREATRDPDALAGQEHIYEAQVILQSLGYDVEGIDGEMNEATALALRRFQEACGLEAEGKLTMLSMVELRNRWRSQQALAPGQSSRALLGHVARRVSMWVGGRWRRGA